MKSWSFVFLEGRCFAYWKPNLLQVTKRLNRLFNITLFYNVAHWLVCVYFSSSELYYCKRYCSQDTLFYCSTVSLSYLTTVVYQRCLSLVAGGHAIFPSQSVFLLSVLLFTWLQSCQSTQHTTTELQTSSVQPDLPLGGLEQASGCRAWPLREQLPLVQHKPGILGEGVGCSAGLGACLAGEAPWLLCRTGHLRCQYSLPILLHGFFLFPGICEAVVPSLLLITEPVYPGWFMVIHQDAWWLIEQRCEILLRP